MSSLNVQQQTCYSDPTGPFADKANKIDCTTDKDKTQTLTEICIPISPYTEWTQWTSCFPECTALNSAEQSIKTRTRQCKPDFIAIDDPRCDQEWTRKLLILSMSYIPVKGY